MNFKEFDELIHSQTTPVDLTDDVVLEKGEEQIYKNGIEIDLDTLKINGNGHAIDARGKTRIFNITTQLQVVITDLVFKNGHHDKGGAINNYSKLLTLGNCSFEDNVAADGGAICNHAYLKAIECSFKFNYSKYSSDIYNWDWLILKRCKFRGICDDVILNLNHVSLEECDFEAHHRVRHNLFESSDGNDGAGEDGEVPAPSDMHIEEKNSNAMSFSDLKNLIGNGGEIFLDNDVEFKLGDEKFKEGIVLVARGYEDDDKSYVFLDKELFIDGKGHSIDARDCARIFNILDENLEVTFRDISFKNAYFSGKSSKDISNEGGGAIYNYKAKCSLEYCEFLNNCGCDFGGAIFNNMGDMTFYECTFDKNSTEGAAGVILNHAGSLEFINCIFTHNSSKQAGAVLADFAGELKFTWCCFKHNSTEFKGIIALGHNVSFDFISSFFFENSVREGPYVYKTSFF